MSRATVQRRLESLAREQTEKAFDTVLDVMTNELNEPRDRLAAAKEIFDRGYGKATQAISAPQGADAQLLAALSDDELIEAVNGAQLPRIVQHNEPDADKTRAARRAYAEGKDPLLD